MTFLSRRQLEAEEIPVSSAGAQGELFRISITSARSTPFSDSSESVSFSFESKDSRGTPQ